MNHTNNDARVQDVGRILVGARHAHHEQDEPQESKQNIVPIVEIVHHIAHGIHVIVGQLPNYHLVQGRNDEIKDDECNQKHQKHDDLPKRLVGIHVGHAANRHIEHSGRVGKGTQGTVVTLHPRSVILHANHGVGRYGAQINDPIIG